LLVYCMGFYQCFWLNFNVLTPALVSTFVYGDGALIVGAA
jgi:hypothetical protein